MNLHAMLETLAAETAARIARENGMTSAVHLTLPEDFLMVGFADDNASERRDRLVLCIGGEDIKAHTCLETLMRDKLAQAQSVTPHG